MALALVLGIAGTAWQAVHAKAAEREQKRLRHEAETARGQAQADAQKARSEAAKSQQLARFLQDMLKGVGPSVALGRDTTILREILDKTAERVSQELTNQPDVEIKMRLTLASTYEELGFYPQELQMAQRSLRLARSMPGENTMVAEALGECRLRAASPRQAGRSGKHAAGGAGDGKEVCGR